MTTHSKQLNSFKELKPFIFKHFNVSSFPGEENNVLKEFVLNFHFSNIKLESFAKYPSTRIFFELSIPSTGYHQAFVCWSTHGDALGYYKVESADINDWGFYRSPDFTNEGFVDLLFELLPSTKQLEFVPFKSVKQIELEKAIFEYLLFSLETPAKKAFFDEFQPVFFKTKKTKDFPLNSLNFYISVGVVIDGKRLDFEGLLLNNDFILEGPHSGTLNLPLLLWKNLSPEQQIKHEFFHRFFLHDSDTLCYFMRICALEYQTTKEYKFHSLFDSDTKKNVEALLSHTESERLFTYLYHLTQLPF